MKTNYSACISRGLRQLFTLVLLMGMFFGARQASASHAAGSDLTYQYLGNNQYLVTYTMYRDCFGISAPTTKSLRWISNSCGIAAQTITMNRVVPTGQEITFNCPGVVSTCNGGTAPGIQQYVYTATVTLPQGCPDWNFSVTECCRNAAITTLNNPASDDLYIEAYLNNTTINNSSPVFSNVPVAFMCIGQDNYYNHGVIDAEGDSLVYSFINPRDAANVPVSYNSGFSIANPLSSVPGVSINPATGDIFMRPTASEVGVIAVLIREYRNGVLIGSVMRDLQIYTIACSNTLPNASGINGTTDFATSSCVGGQLCFDVISADPNPNDSLFMTWNQGIPGATFTITPGMRPTGRFCWSPTAAQARPQPYTFTVTVRDNACPSNGVQTYSFSILVSNLNVSLTSTPSVSCYGAHNGSASATVSGAGPFSYLWTGPGGIEFTTPSISHLSAGNYTMNVMDSAGCVGTQYFTIAQPAPLNVSITPVNAGCNSTLGSATANVSGGTPNYTYTWNTIPAQTTQTASDLAAGSYTVNVRDANGCRASQSVTIQGSIPISAVMNTTPATCLANDGTASVVVTGGSGNISYAWFPNVSSGATASGLITGVYDVVVTDNTSGCTINLSGIVANSAGVSASISSSTDATCSNSDNGTAMVVGSGGTLPYTYLWMPNGDTTAYVNNLSPGTHQAIVEDYDGCRAIAVVTIGFQFQAPVVDLGADTVVCLGTNYVLDAGAGFSSYLWSNNSTGQTLTVNASGSYSVLVSDANGCENFDAVNVNFIQCQSIRTHGTTTSTYEAVSVFPNPTNGQIQVAIARLRDVNVSVRIMDILGNQLYFTTEKADYSYSKSIDIQHLAAGIYMLRVEYAGEVKTIRLVKE